jgi:hypothetical protein
VSRATEYRAKAREHVKLAQNCHTNEVRKIHGDIAESFLALAETEERLEGEGLRPIAGNSGAH